MEQMVSRILDAEKEAESVLQRARAKAAELRSQADAESEKLLQQTRQEAQERQRAALKRVREQIEQTRREALGRIEEANRSFLEQHGEAIERTSDKVVELVLKPQLPGPEAEG